MGILIAGGKSLRIVGEGVGLEFLREMQRPEKDRLTA